MDVGLRIKQTRNLRKMSAEALGKLIGKDRATIYRYEKNEIENVPYTIICNIAEALNVHPAYLMGWEDVESGSSYTYFPVSVSAGTLLEVSAVTNGNTISIPDHLLGRWAGQKDLFFIRVNGDSMNRILPDGSLIAVKPINRDDLKNNDIVVFSVSYDYGVKRYLRKDNDILFKPESFNEFHTDYKTTADNENLCIHGKVVWYSTELD